jgi:hypothetical protein
MERTSYCSEWGNWLGIGFVHDFGGQLEKVVSEELCYDEKAGQHYMKVMWEFV